ncbi:MAG: DUF2905 domain-containing protein [Candidatus Dormibacteria bacterium]
MSLGRVLIGIGAVLVVAGILVQLGLPLGRLPGDLRFTRGSIKIYSPLATGLLLSIVLTILINVLLRR